MAKKKTKTDDLLKRMKNKPYYAVLHAINFIEGRLPEEVEACLGDDPEACLLYAKKVMKGKLPDHLHNKMVLLGGSEAKEYLDSLSGKKPEKSKA